MCLTVQTTYILCMHATVTTHPCSYSQSTSSSSSSPAPAPSSLATLLAFFSAKCRPSEKDMYEKEFCPGCNRIWDALDVPDKERRRRTDVFRRRNGYQGQLTPLKMEGDAGVVFRCDFGEMVEPGGEDGKGKGKLRGMRNRGFKGLEGSLEPASMKSLRPPPQSASISIPSSSSSSKRSQQTDRSSLSLSVSLVPSTSNASSTSTLWPSTNGYREDEKAFFVERDEFGNPLESTPPKRVLGLRNPFAEVEFELHEVGREGGEPDGVGWNGEGEGDGMGKEKENGRSRTSTIRAIAPMVAPIVKPVNGARKTAVADHDGGRDGDRQVEEQDLGEVEIRTRTVKVKDKGGEVEERDLSDADIGMQMMKY